MRRRLVRPPASASSPAPGPATPMTAGIPGEQPPRRLLDAGALRAADGAARAAVAGRPAGAGSARGGRRLGSAGASRSAWRRPSRRGGPRRRGDPAPVDWRPARRCRDDGDRGRDRRRSRRRAARCGRGPATARLGLALGALAVAASAINWALSGMYLGPVDYLVQVYGLLVPLQAALVGRRRRSRDRADARLPEPRPLVPAGRPGAAPGAALRRCAIPRGRPAGARRAPPGLARERRAEAGPGGPGSAIIAGTAWLAEASGERRPLGLLLGFRSLDRPDVAVIHGSPSTRRTAGAGSGATSWSGSRRRWPRAGRHRAEATCRPDDRIALGFFAALGFVPRAGPGSSRLYGVPAFADWDGPGEDRVLLEPGRRALTAVARPAPAGRGDDRGAGGASPLPGADLLDDRDGVSCSSSSRRNRAGWSAGGTISSQRGAAARPRSRRRRRSARADGR